MQKDIHPTSRKIKVTCQTCNAEYEFESTKNDLKIDVCSNCHPFYNGKSTYNRAASRIEKFNKKYSK